MLSARLSLQCLLFVDDTIKNKETNTEKILQRAMKSRRSSGGENSSLHTSTKFIVPTFSLSEIMFSIAVLTITVKNWLSNRLIFQLKFLVIFCVALLPILAR